MRIAQVSSEFQPLVKVGGLADVVYGLTDEYVKKKYDSFVILPNYQFLNIKNYPIHKTGSLIYRKDGEKKESKWVEILVKKIPIILISVGVSKNSVYEGSTDGEFFTTFSLLASIFLKTNKVDIVQLNDWLVSQVAYFLKNESCFVFNMHSSHCGVVSSGVYKSLGKEEPSSDNFFDIFSYKKYILPRMLKYMDAIIVVSKSYSKEIFKVKLNRRLKKSLIANKEKIRGITNGISNITWNPSSDPYLHHHYSASFSIENILKKKIANKKMVQNRFKMKEGDIPLVVVISRLDKNKGLSFIQQGLNFAQSLGAQVFLLGTGDPLVIKKFKYHKCLLKNGHYELKFDEPLSHMLFAGADYILIPSKIEPCGLTQLIAMRYGGYPIAHAVGGLKDTIQNKAEEIDKTKGIGTLFHKYSYSVLKKAIKESLDIFRTCEHDRIMKHNMQVDFSWNRPSDKYLSHFTNLIDSRHSFS